MHRFEPHRMTLKREETTLQMRVVKYVADEEFEPLKAISKTRLTDFAGWWYDEASLIQTYYQSTSF